MMPTNLPTDIYSAGCTALHCVIATIVAVYIASVSFIEAKEK